LSLRVVSLLPSATEIVCSLGLENTLVGRSHECDYPAVVRKLPVLTSAAIDVDASSRAIDDQVKSHLRDGISIYKINVDLLKELKPDVILTQGHCEVCAVTAKDVEKSWGASVGKSVKIISLQPTSLGGVWDDVRHVGKELGAEKNGLELAARLEKQVSAIAAQTRSLDPVPRVACVEWIDPLMAAGNWVPELVKAAGGYNLFGEAGHHSPWMEWSALVEKDPDFLLLMPCGFDIKRTRNEMGVLMARPEWLHLRAVTDNRVFLLDGNHYFNRPGPRLVESLEILAEILHPETFDFGHKMTGWQYF
jgi:iron complex transport system substrate-binding protein